MPHLAPQKLLVPLPMPALMRYGLPAASVGAGLALTFVFLPFNLPLPFTPLALSAIAVTFWFGGTNPGIVPFLLAMMTRSHFFDPHTSTLSKVLYELVFVIFAVLMSWVRRSRTALEVRVAERTAKLTEINESLQREIADREQAENDLRRQTEQLDGLLELAPDAVILSDERYYVLRVNREFT